jgi:hypothetical protein
VALICICALVRTAHAAVVVYHTRDGLVVPLHVTSVVAGLCAACSALVAHYWLDITTKNEDLPFFLFFTAEFTMFLM